MNVYVDGTQVDMSDIPVETVADVIGMIAKDLDSSRRVVRVSVDGEDITGVSERHLETISAMSKFEITTAKATEFAAEVLESLSEFRNSLIKELEKTAEEFRSGSFEKSNEFLARCVDGLSVLLKTTMSVAGLLQLQLSQVKAGDKDLEASSRKINQVLEEMIEAQTNRDGILIADLIEYELNPLIDDWNAGIAYLKTTSGVV